MINSLSRVIIAFATCAFIGWTALITVFWPLEDYGNIVHVYAERTHEIAMGMSIGVTAYLSVLGIVIVWNVTKRDDRQLIPVERAK